jgi:hypothetical protein
VRPNRLAVAALVLAVVSLPVPVLPAVVALVLAAVAARRTRDAPADALGGRGLVTAACALSVVSLVVWTGLAALVVVAPAQHAEPMARAAPADIAPADIAPTTVAPGPTTGADERWLEALDKLSTKLDEPFAEQTFELTPAKTRSLEKLFRDCSRELARLGSPSDRLQPVYRLVKQACAQYDKAAKCLATAASSPEGWKQTQAYDCAFAAHPKGSILLSEAEIEGLVIMAEGG